MSTISSSKNKVLIKCSVLIGWFFLVQVQTHAQRFVILRPEDSRPSWIFGKEILLITVNLYIIVRWRAAIKSTVSKLYSPPHHWIWDNNLYPHVIVYFWRGIYFFLISIAKFYRKTWKMHTKKMSLQIQTRNFGWIWWKNYWYFFM